MKVKRIRWLLSAPEGELFPYLKDVLPNYGYRVREGHFRGQTAYIYGEGRLPVMLVAHVDGVNSYGEPWWWDEERMDELELMLINGEIDEWEYEDLVKEMEARERWGEERQVYYDQAYQVFWGPGMMADDRAGVIAILELLRMGFRPSVLFTNGEESGCWGAWRASEEIKVNANVVIGLDRRGSNDAVYYGCRNREIRRWVERFGWEEAIGSVSDIAVLCPNWDIAGVNLSVGYYNEHTDREILRFGELKETIRRVGRMLLDLPGKRLRYK